MENFQDFHQKRLKLPFIVNRHFSFCDILPLSFLNICSFDSKNAFADSVTSTKNLQFQFSNRKKLTAQEVNAAIFKSSESYLIFGSKMNLVYFESKDFEPKIQSVLRIQHTII